MKNWRKWDEFTRAQLLSSFGAIWKHLKILARCKIFEPLSSDFMLLFVLFCSFQANVRFPLSQLDGSPDSDQWQAVLLPRLWNARRFWDSWTWLRPSGDDKRSESVGMDGRELLPYHALPVRGGEDVRKRQKGNCSGGGDTSRRVERLPQEQSAPPPANVGRTRNQGP